MTQAAASSVRNGSGLFVPSQEEAEELERALAVEGVPIPMMDKYSNHMGGVVGHPGESDLSDLSLIDDHTLALAHDLMSIGAGTTTQNLLMNNQDPTSVSSSSAYMDNLSIPHPSIIHTGTHRKRILPYVFILHFFTLPAFRLRYGYVRISDAFQEEEPFDDSCWSATQSRSWFKSAN